MKKMMMSVCGAMLVASLGGCSQTFTQGVRDRQATKMVAYETAGRDARDLAEYYCRKADEVERTEGYEASLPWRHKANEQTALVDAARRQKEGARTGVWR